MLLNRQYQWFTLLFGMGAAGVWGGDTGGTGNCDAYNTIDGGTGTGYCVPDAIYEASERNGVDPWYYIRMLWKGLK